VKSNERFLREERDSKNFYNICRIWAYLHPFLEMHIGACTSGVLGDYMQSQLIK
jgi:hypothetical protein